MNKQNIPKLRFPEFKGEWEKKKLGEVGSLIGGGTPSTQNLKFWSGNIPWVSSSDLTDDSIYQISTTRFITNDAIAHSATKLIPQKSILIVSRVGVGKVAINNTALCTSQDFTNLIPNENNYIFLAYLLKIKTNRLLEFNQGTSIKGFVKSDLETLGIEIPSLPEQTRIASFFTVIDKKLSQLKQKKNLLEEYKKGLMQKLFSQELRFKIKNEDGELVEPPKWEKKRLGEVVTIKSGLSKDQNISDTGYRVTRIETISDGTINLEKVGFIEVDENIEDYKLNKGDILFSNINSVSHIGKTAIVEENLDLYHGMNLLCLRSIDRMNSRFLFYWLNTNKSRNYFKTICNQAVSQASINQTELAKTELQIPCEKEQTLIANFLTAIDKKIMHCEKQIEQTEIWKKGLLQKMFV